MEDVSDPRELKATYKELACGLRICRGLDFGQRCNSFGTGLVLGFGFKFLFRRNNGTHGESRRSQIARGTHWNAHSRLRDLRKKDRNDY